jgi:hypothetical protein
MPIPSSIRLPRRRNLAVALSGALCLTAALAPAGASAGGVESVLTTTTSGISVLETPETRQTCQAPSLVQPFAGLGDSRDYVLAPGGSFEGKDLDGWQVRKAVSDKGGSPLEVSDEDNKRSLKIPPGGSATSPAMCVDLHYPTMRLMAKGQQGKGVLQVEVIYPDSDNPVFQPVGSLAAAGKDWQASDDVSVFPERGGAAPGMRRVALRFTSAANDGTAGEWKIDDLYVDPHRR